MLTARDVAIYFLSKDPERKLYNDNLIENPHSKPFYEGNAVLNKHLHLSQNVWIAMTGEKLFEDSLYALPHGAVVESVMGDFFVLFEKKYEPPKLEKEVKIFLDKIYETLKYASYSELIDLSHEDEEWMEKSKNKDKKAKEMDSLKRKSQYAHQYANIIWALNRMDKYE